MKNDIDGARLSRPIHDMPEFIAEALDREGLWEDYRLRPPYQQNDYVGWISRAKRPETPRMKRLNQMIRELREGVSYMKMEYHGPTSRNQKP